MAGTYNYMKVAKMVMDASSVLLIDSSNAVLKSTSLTATNLVTKTLNWDNAYNPTPNNNTPLNAEILDTPNVTFNKLSVQGTTDLSGSATFGSLTTGSIRGGLRATTATIGTLDVSNNTVLTGTTIAGSVVSSTLNFGSLSTSNGVNVDTSGNFIISQKLNVNGYASLLDSMYITNNVTVNQNVGLTGNLSILNNKYIGNTVSVGGPSGTGELQMWDGSGYSDPSGFIVSLTSTQLQSLLNLLI